MANNGFSQEKLLQYINLKLASMGQPHFRGRDVSALLEMADPLLRSGREKSHSLGYHLCPADRRIQDFLDAYLADLKLERSPRLPDQTFSLDRPGMARAMSLPPDMDIFSSDIITSYRVKQGVLHNPKSDRRTTKGVFHVTEGGFPIPGDKVAAPKIAFARLLEAAFHAPADLLRLPLTASQTDQARLFVSLLMRPTICPEAPGLWTSKSMEIRFFVPGNLISNLDFVESIFGNGGDPLLPENDAALDIEHWSGHTGCVVLAPHLIRLRKKDLGLPPYSRATARQRRDGMCWKKPSELYNDGQAFKITARDARGVIVTLIADNYFGYCKKEVKTQISFAANLYGLAEEEHAGGAIAFASYDLGEEFSVEPAFAQSKTTFAEMVALYRPILDLRAEGYAVDKSDPDILFVPDGAKFSLKTQTVSWHQGAVERQIPLMAGKTYLLPSGYKIFIKKQTGGTSWHLVGIVAEGTFCHKPCTVSGGGKSEISKPIVDAMIQAPVFTADFHKDIDAVAKILEMDFGHRFRETPKKKKKSRPILSSERSLGSVIKLLTPSPEYTDTYNTWIASIPPHIRDLIYVIKRHYKPEWGKDWKGHFNVDVVNGSLGHELKMGRKKLISNYLRIGREKDGSWRIFKVRQDFAAAEKIQTEDDISATAVVPSKALKRLGSNCPNPSVKLAHNCEQYLFQRPDDAVHRGYDKQAESDLASPGTFLSNFEPLGLGASEHILHDSIGFDLYTDPMKELIRGFVEAGREGFIVSSAHPRMVDGKPSKNPRYLQRRPDLVQPRRRHLAEVGTRLFRRVPLGEPVHLPVNAVLPGRRMNPSDPKAGIPALAVYNPIHYQELPELFMDFISSVTGKSPSTTGFGSEGALTKGPFNALWPVVDLNNALVSFLATGYPGFSSAAGFIGPNYRVDHDISLLVPEIWCRMTTAEKDPAYLIKHEYLERVEDLTHRGKRVQASILGWRITAKFVRHFLGRIFSNPTAVFLDEMLRPERQDREVFVEGIENLTATYQRVALHYIEDGSIRAACPPIQALLDIMARGKHRGKTISDPAIRSLFTRESMVRSAWYKERLVALQKRQADLLRRHRRTISSCLAADGSSDPSEEAQLKQKLVSVERRLKHTLSPSFLKKVSGTIGADPLKHQLR